MGALPCSGAEVSRKDSGIVPGGVRARTSPFLDMGVERRRSKKKELQRKNRLSTKQVGACWGSPHPINTIAVVVVRTTTWTPQNAPHAAFARRWVVTPKTCDGMIGSLRVLKACRKTAVAARKIALQVIQNSIICAPEELRDVLRNLTRMQLVRTLAAWRPDLSDYRNVTSAYRIALKSLGRRYLELHDEIADLDAMIAAIVEELAPSLVARNSIGRESAAQLLLTAGDNVDRIRSESSFAALCGVSPVPASSGKVIRHRLNRGGDRAANSALHVIAIGRLRTDPKTKAYIAKKIAEGHSKLEALRCLKRYIAREVYALVRERNREIAQTRIVT